MQFYHAIQEDAAEALSEEDSQHWSYERLVQHIGKRHGQDKTWHISYLPDGSCTENQDSL